MPSPPAAMYISESIWIIDLPIGTHTGRTQLWDPGKLLHRQISYVWNTVSAYRPRGCLRMGKELQGKNTKLMSNTMYLRVYENILISIFVGMLQH